VVEKVSAIVSDLRARRRASYAATEGA
jgi:hypothetical protein